ncbi:MAG TPA: hypothetical protein VGV37_06435 [Aliidongia sp.]|uniref:hypothetical protein n=1 Tax=Aliidongia sp. TaxID=1914230 RepID=UPI002DDCF35F|nr:hypothetical protein [Aliidongia sp.]HEV2674163.1 hypothetical protein [Aliidongia sp.]
MPVGFSAATYAAAAAIAGAAVSAYGQISSANSAASSANYQAQIAKNNATIAKQNEEYATEAGSAQSEMVGIKGAAAGGRIKAQQSANGVDVNSGSAVAVQKGQRSAGALDQQTAANNAFLQAYGYRSQVATDQAVSGLDSSEASSDQTAGALGAGGTLLNGASSIGFKWLGSQNPSSGGFGATNQIGASGSASQTDGGFAVGPV